VLDDVGFSAHGCFSGEPYLDLDLEREAQALLMRE
jgi:hypothetical protein